MAYRVIRIDPIDLQPSVAVGVSIPFNGPVAFNSTYTTQEQIRSNLIHYLLTEPGEIIMNPEFGGGLRRYVFEQLTSDTISDIDIFIRKTIENNFPTIQLKGLDLLSNQDEHSILIKLTYSILDTPIEDTIVIEIRETQDPLSL